MRVKVGVNVEEGEGRAKIVEKVLAGAEKVENEEKTAASWEAVSSA